MIRPILLSCSVSAVALAGVAPASGSWPASAAVVPAANRFAFAFAAETDAPGAPENFVASPVGVYSALALARSGAAGATRDEFTSAMSLPKNFNDSDIRVLTAGLARKEKDSAALFTNASAVFVDMKRAKLTPVFSKTSARDFGAAAFPVDFSDAVGACGIINRWCSDGTGKMIPSIFSPQSLPKEAALVLANAVYFKGHWSDEFAKSATKTEPFTTGSGVKVNAPLMHQTDHFRYTADKNFLYAELPYQGGEYFMALVLPKVAGAPSELTSEGFAFLAKSAKHTRLDLTLPRFTIRKNLHLEGALKKLGVSRAFSDAAEFSPMAKSPEPLKIGKVIHEAVIKVDEEGSEAAAVTVIVPVPVCSIEPPPPPPVPFRCDRPFRFFIVHRATGAVLFSGRVEDPTKG